jgi:hypothetical protein
LINADDEFVVPETFQEVVDCWTKQPRPDLIYGKILRIDEHGNRLPNLNIQLPPKLWLERHYSYVQHCSLFISRQFISEKQIYLDITLKYAADWDWIIRLIQASQHIEYIHSPLSCFRLHKNQRSYTAKSNDWIEEKQIIIKRYKSIYGVHRFLTILLNIRALMIISVFTLKTKGISGFLQRLASSKLFRRQKP